ncbi:MAG: GIY-YIG nuclease family protein [Patescibacteria group bacterium]
MDWHVYVLQSETDGRRYVGMSSDVERRLTEHNSGQVTSTKSHRPYAIIYQETLPDRHKARSREKYLKSGAGREFITSRIPR